MQAQASCGKLHNNKGQVKNYKMAANTGCQCPTLTHSHSLHTHSPHPHTCSEKLWSCACGGHSFAVSHSDALLTTARLANTSCRRPPPPSFTPAALPPRPSSTPATGLLSTCCKREPDFVAVVTTNGLSKFTRRLWRLWPLGYD